MNLSMDSNLFCSPKSSFSTPLSLLLSYPSSSLKSSSWVKTHVSFQPRTAEKTSFFGQTLVPLEKKLEFCNLRRNRFPLHQITAAVKRRKEMPFDNVIQREKKLKLVLKIRKILVNQPNRIMSLRDLGRHRRAIGLTRKRRFISLLKRFPGVFEIVEEGAYSLQFRMTPKAEQIYLEELKVRNEMEGLLVIKLRKLLMMSLEKKILLEKIGHLRTDLGLPPDFQDTICLRYPQYFKVVHTEQGPALELTHWDPELAISAAELSEEEKVAREIEERNLIIDRPPKFNRVNLPKGLKLSRGEMKRILKFQQMPYISPYSDFSELRAGSDEKEKHACAVVHELLSFCVEKRTLVDHLTHFRNDFRFSQQLRGMLIRHPELFYVSLKGSRDSVFLREAYHKSQLIEKDRLLIIKEKLNALVAIPRFPKRGAPEIREGDDNEGTERTEEGRGNENDEEDWSDIDNMLSDGDGDDDEDYSEDEDDWSDEDDETPPDFYHTGDESLSLDESKSLSQVQKSGDALDPYYPDGRPRERW